MTPPTQLLLGFLPGVECPKCLTAFIDKGSADHHALTCEPSQQTREWVQVVMAGRTKAQ